MVANPADSAAAGLNPAVAASSGRVVSRVDAHALLPVGYLDRMVALLEETGADNVGGLRHLEG